MILGVSASTPPALNGTRAHRETVCLTATLLLTHDSGLRCSPSYDCREEREGLRKHCRVRGSRWKERCNRRSSGEGVGGKLTVTQSLSFRHAHPPIYTCFCVYL